MLLLKLLMLLLLLLLLLPLNWLQASTRHIGLSASGPPAAPQAQHGVRLVQRLEPLLHNLLRGVEVLQVWGCEVWGGGGVRGVRVLEKEGSGVHTQGGGGGGTGVSLANA